MGLERAAWLQRRYGAQVDWYPFDLHPEYPPEGIPRSQIEARYPEGFADRVRKLIEGAGLEYRRPEVSPNSMGSLQLAELARDRGRFEELHARLFRAYWAEGRNIGQREELIDIGIAAGLAPEEMAEVLEHRPYRERIETSTRTARELGVDGIPAWIIDQAVLVPGAQPHDVFEEALRRLGYSPLEGDERSA